MDIDSLFAQTLQGEYDDEAPWEAVHQLRAMGSREVFERAAGWCSAEDALQRARGADVLAQLGKTVEDPHSFPEESFTILVSMALNEQDSQALSSAIHALGHIGDRRGVPLFANYSTHPDSLVRFAVACACGNIPNEPLSAETLIELMSDEDVDTRDWATFGLGSLSDLDSAAIREQLAIALGDADDDVRQEALTGLAKRHDHKALPHLFARLEKPEVDEMTIEAAGLMLGNADAPEAWGPKEYVAALRDRFAGEAA